MSKLHELVKEYQDLELQIEAIKLRQSQIKDEFDTLIPEKKAKIGNVTIMRQTRRYYTYTPALLERFKAAKQQEEETGEAKEEVRETLVVRVNKNAS